jgi:predicted NUDIX family phosphoesterase
MKKDEHILVIKRSLLFNQNPWHGIMDQNLEYYVHTIQTKQEFHPRSQMEEDFTYKQIIPYLIFRYQQRYFLMQRSHNASEKRLQNKFSLGIGGHIRQEDIKNNCILDWAQREFHEEIVYEGSYTSQLIGILNDDSSDVGKVHMGLVFLLDGNSDKISIRSELKSGSLYSLEECKQHYDHLETWSKIVLTHLI